MITEMTIWTYVWVPEGKSCPVAFPGMPKEKSRTGMVRSEFVVRQTIQRTCVIVDGYSSGNLYAPELIKRGFSVVHVQSSEVIAPDFRPSFHSEDYVDNIIHDGDLEKTTDAVKRFSPIALFAGTESGVRLADGLSEQLGLPSNGRALSHSRRDKFLMIETVRNAGLLTCSQIVSKSLEKILLWARETEFPIVLKPTESAGTDNVFICRNSRPSGLIRNHNE